ncbi:MAG: hypothetical protein ACTSY1_07395 [Alphaproteobacteria bacterium]
MPAGFAKLVKIGENIRAMGHSIGWLGALAMPSVFRLLIVLAVLGGIGYGAMFALVQFVQPEPREITHAIPKSKLKVFRDQN